ncbi:unnamed protein product [Linum trigynum]|uniref:RNase H type-1 domain-containing protein n=1 Tax=Linum trigynum TaxID=586398 RepID=A0AAV2FEG3_9ROSI
MSRIWRTSEVADCFAVQPATNSLQWVKRVMDLGDEDKLEKWSVLMWFLWKERNAQMFNGNNLPEDEIVMRAKYYLDDYRTHQQREHTTPLNQEPEVWEQSGPGQFKINKDASFAEPEGMVLGAVIRGQGGDFLLAAAKKVVGGQSVEMGESLAAEFDMQLAKHFNVQNPCLESDCLSFIQKLSRSDEIQKEMGIICRSVHRMLKELGNGSSRHVRRTANEAAHLTAQAKPKMNETVVWLDSPPAFLLNELQLDCIMANAD